MNIAVDGFELGGGARGVGRVILNLLPSLAAQRPQDSFVVCTKEEIDRARLPGVSEVVLQWHHGYLRWLNGPLRRALLAAKPDVFLAPNYVLPVFYSGQSVLFEHDISAVAHPEWYPRKYALTRKLLVRRSLDRAAAVIAPSEFTRKEILSSFGLPEDKVKTIRYGIEDAFRPEPRERVERWKAARGLGGKRLVGFLGSIFKRRHVAELVRSVDGLRREMPDLGLFLVGENLGGLGPAERDRILVEPWIQWKKALPEEELTLFYSSLDAFAYLSEYEGFGFPPLEALACGTPAVVFDRASLAEVCGGLAVMVESVDEAEIVRGLRAALTDESVRAALPGAFAARRAEFSWARAASELGAVISGLRP
jgi:glycosyltransferase involved in cell wall biosynthesis